MAGGPQPVSIHNSINLPIRKSRLKWIVELLNGPGQPPISSSPTNPNQADASLCLCVQFLIGGLYCYNTFYFIHQFSSIIAEFNKKKVYFSLFEWRNEIEVNCLLPPLSFSLQEKQAGVNGYVFLAQQTQLQSLFLHSLSSINKKTINFLLIKWEKKELKEMEWTGAGDKTYNQPPRPHFF